MLYNTLYKLHLKYNFPLFKRGNCFYVPILYDCVYTNYILNTISPVFESIPSYPPKSRTVLLVLWVYDLMDYTTSAFGAAEPSTPDQGFEIDHGVV